MTRQFLIKSYTFSFYIQTLRRAGLLFTACSTECVLADTIIIIPVIGSLDSVQHPSFLFYLKEKVIRWTRTIPSSRSPARAIYSSVRAFFILRQINFYPSSLSLSPKHTHTHKSTQKVFVDIFCGKTTPKVQKSSSSFYHFGLLFYYVCVYTSLYYTVSDSLGRLKVYLLFDTWVKGFFSSCSYLLLFADESQEVDVVIVMAANVGQDAQVTSSQSTSVAVIRLCLLAVLSAVLNGFSRWLLLRQRN
jgi:hypothetical protein